ncbi:MAG TPA: crotonase/enoyl-CoA hydratase family protein [Vitreimonas sp.]|uniref:crotonase/enoyl-CoA hydratase family protein n=1 Tax=Vitreimonas sp. TaxID=3069702 RepID=UPI002D5AF42D|nr:crotonase/enoyl-CoA hydratase family protein [Vitreimonas sp.]HYD86515.1 crotonase/enoyl-CoA hydratase family protein [Vitreimonas sp.]
MTESCFAVSIENNIAHIVLNRPKAFNAMPRPFWNELPKIVNDINDNAKARVIVISSTGKHFTAGMDISVFTDGESITAQGGDQHTRAEAFRQFVLTLQGSFNCLDTARMPVIAAIQGGCIGAGVDMTSACDIRYATADAFFQVAEINIGMTADVGTFPRLCKLIPEGWVRELAYSGRRLPAQRAKEIGLVNDVFATHEDMLAHVMDLAREIATKAPVAVAGSKRMINHARDHSIADGLDYIATWQAGMFSPPHMMEAFAAKAQKREPIFPDLAPIRKEM